MSVGAIRRALGGERGTASVELIASLPLLLLGLAAAAQVAVSGYALWSAGLAARAGARQAEIGAEVRPAVSRALPSVLRGGFEVEDGSPVRVTVPVPRILPLLPDLHVQASASLGSPG